MGWAACRDAMALLVGGPPRAPFFSLMVAKVFGIVHSRVVTTIPVPGVLVQGDRYEPA